MAFAVLGDIHSNLAALEAVLQRLEELEIDEVFFVGDLVGYNASPAEVIFLFQQRNFIGINGNHDRYTTGQEMRDVRETTIEAVEYTRGAIGDTGMAFLKNLPDHRSVDDRYLLVHGSILDRDEYMLTAEIVSRNMKTLHEDYNGIEACFFGHSHLPAVIGGGRIDMKFTETRTVKLNPMKQYMINPGSVGQPRDSCPLSSFGVFDPQACTMTIHRVEYDVEDSRQRVLDAGLGRGLADRLLVGR
jgi:predicted phosphodiesterase